MGCVAKTNGSLVEIAKIPILARDQHVLGYEYEGICPDRLRCRYSTDFYLIDYMGEPTRFGISHKEDFEVVRTAPSI